MNFCMSIDFIGTSTDLLLESKDQFQKLEMSSSFCCILCSWSLLPDTFWLISLFFCHLSHSVRPLTSPVPFIFLSHCSFYHHSLSVPLVFFLLLLFPLAQDNKNDSKYTPEHIIASPVSPLSPYKHAHRGKKREKFPFKTPIGVSVTLTRNRTQNVPFPRHKKSYLLQYTLIWGRTDTC